MNIEAQAELIRIVAIEPNALTDNDKAVLQARRSYLTKEQSELFADVLAEKPAKEKPNTLTKNELQAELTARKIEFKPTDKVADLQALLDAAPDNQE